MPATRDETDSPAPYDALLIVGFGGPERPEDVMPFLENVTRGRDVPRERLEEVAQHYHHFGGKSPINDQVRALIADLSREMGRQGVGLPIYWGNRNWAPMLADTIRTMAEDGVRRALGLVLAAYSSYSSCRQYQDDIIRAREDVGPSAPEVDKVRVFYNHPDFIAAAADRLGEALDLLPAGRRGSAHVAFTAHSIPQSMASRCRYEIQLAETCRLSAEAVGMGPDRWSLVYQSRSGRPQDPWLGPDILEHLSDLSEQGVREVVIDPVGFLSDHLEVLYDLDEEATRRARELGMTAVRARTVGLHPRFVSMLVELVRERLGEAPGRAVGRFGPNPDICPADCCLPPPRPVPRPAGGAGR